MPTLLRRMRNLTEPKPLAPATITCDGTPLEVRFRRNRSARRLVLRLDQAGMAAILTVPNGVSRAQALDFVSRSSDWLSARLAQRGENIPLRGGQRFPFRGADHEIRHVVQLRGTVTLDPVEQVFLVPGDAVHVPRRLLDWLKAAARADLTRASQRYALLMNVRYRRLSIRDQRSRWGSCSAAGDLSYSWRLILVPPYVLDYVAAHEVAHLLHMNHGTRFWRLVLTHCPDAPRAKKWLKQHGHGVHRVVA